jgi:polysaccharide export outer membrane protein
MGTLQPSLFRRLPQRGASHDRIKDIQVNTLKQNGMAWWTRAALALLALTLGACASKAPLAALDMQQPPAHEYLIGPGDNVNIVVWRNPEVSTSVPVRPDGKITTPLVEDLEASGKTSTALARDIEKALAKFIQQPVVTVVVTNFVSTYGEQIRVIGQATRPQALPYRRDMSLMDVLIAVGGVTEFASGNKATIIRKVGGKSETVPVRLNDLIKEGDISANIYMRPGDVLVIPESFF